jgi:hypothetical protein
MLTLDFSAETIHASAFLSRVSERHVPFAASRALNSTAFSARDAVRQDMPHRFIIRRPWILRGIGVETSTKSELSASVFSRDKFMAEQEYGGIRNGTQSIPVGRMAQIYSSRVIPKAQRPAALMQKKNIFYLAGSLFERRSSGIQSLYIFRKRVKIAPRFGMSETVRSVALRMFEAQFIQYLQDTLVKE